jgi:hypothetical protein
MTEQPMMVQPSKKLSEEPVFIKNARGTVSCWPKHKAVDMVSKNMGWGYASPEEIELEQIPGEKAFPLTGGRLTEEGLKSRVSQQKQEAAEIGVDKNYTMKELHSLAKEEGIKSFGLKKTDLMDKLGVEDGESLKLKSE